MWTYWICDTLTGVKQALVLPAAFTAQRRLGDQGQGSATFKVGTLGPLGRDQFPPDWNALTRVWARSIVPCWNGVPQYMGIITDTDYDKDTQTYTVTHSDFWTLLGYRSTLGEDGYSTINYRDNYVNFALYSILKMVFRLTFEGPTAGYAMNVAWDHIIPTTAPHDGIDSRQYNDYNLPKMLDTLHELMTAAGGPEVSFQPSWDGSGNLLLTMRIGDVATPKLTGPRLEWHFDVPQPALFKVRRQVKGSQMATNVVATGAGSELDRKFAKAQFEPDYPALERFTSYPQLADQTALQQHADQDLADYKEPIIQWSCSMMADGSPGLLDLVEGQPVGAYSQGDPIIPNGWNEMRNVGWSFDMTNVIQLEIQPIGGA